MPVVRSEARSEADGRRLPTTLHYVPAPQAFFPRMFSRCRVEMLAAGSLRAEDAVKLAQQLEAQLREQ